MVATVSLLYDPLSQSNALAMRKRSVYRIEHLCNEMTNSMTLLLNSLYDLSILWYSDEHRVQKKGGRKTQRLQRL